jgi:hypothetical protein
MVCGQLGQNNIQLEADDRSMKTMVINPFSFRQLLIRPQATLDNFVKSNKSCNLQKTKNEKFDRDFQKRTQSRGPRG